MSWTEKPKPEEPPGKVCVICNKRIDEDDPYIEFVMHMGGAAKDVTKYFCPAHAIKADIAIMRAFPKLRPTLSLETLDALERASEDMEKLHDALDWLGFGDLNGN